MLLTSYDDPPNKSQYYESLTFVSEALSSGDPNLSMLLNLVSLLARGHDHFDLSDLRNKIVLALKNNLD